jgi:hypothetical protein
MECKRLLLVAELARPTISTKQEDGTNQDDGEKIESRRAAGEQPGFGTARVLGSAKHEVELLHFDHPFYCKQDIFIRT